MTRDRHLLVDAFNVIHAWPTLKAMLTQHGAEAARTQLANALRPIYNVEGWRVTIVFDGRGNDILVERPGPELTFSYVFGPKGLSADGVIEQLVANATLPPDEDRRPRKKKTDAPEIVVATRDNLLGEAARACGATLLSPELLLDWVESAAARQTRDVITRQRHAASQWRGGDSPWKKLPQAPR